MTNEKEALKTIQGAVADYFQLSKILFGEDAIGDVNELPSDSPFLQSAKDLAEEMNISWQDMSHEDSNRLMLNLLGDYFAAVQSLNGDYKPVLTVSFQKS